MTTCSDHLDDYYLHKCLLAATRNNSLRNMTRIIMKGAINFDECLELAQELSQYNAIAQLLLCKAAILGDRNLLLDLFLDPLASRDHASKKFVTDIVRNVAKGHEVSMVIPMEIAKKRKHFTIQEDLLMKIDVHKNSSCVYWHELHLLSVEVPWLQKISWVKHLRLDKNCLTSLPDSTGFYLQQVSHN